MLVPATSAARRGWPPGCRAAGALLATAVAVVLMAACSSSPPAPRVASLSPARHPAAVGTALTQAQSNRDMISFARCMRAHAVNMPDPSHQAGHAGLSVSLPPHDATTRTAWAACGHYLAQIIHFKEAAAAAGAAPQLPALTRYARCMRAHDIAMLDPTQQGVLSLGNVPGITSDFGRYTPQFRTADTACRHLLPPGVHDDGTGP